MEQRKFMDAKHDYLIVDPVTLYGINYKPESPLTEKQKEELVEEAGKRYKSMYGIKPLETPFWCYGYDVACAGPIPEVK